MLESFPGNNSWHLWWSTALSFFSNLKTMYTFFLSCALLNHQCSVEQKWWEQIPLTRFLITGDKLLNISHLCIIFAVGFTQVTHGRRLLFPVSSFPCIFIYVFPLNYPIFFHPPSPQSFNCLMYLCHYKYICIALCQYIIYKLIILYITDFIYYIFH